MKAAVFVAGLMIATCASAQPVLLADDNPHTSDWYGYQDTFTVHKDGYSVLVGQRPLAPKPGAPYEVREFIGITTEACKAGSGNLMSRRTPTDPWSTFATVQINSAPVTVADRLAQEICRYGAELRKAQSQPVKKAPARSI